MFLQGGIPVRLKLGQKLLLVEGAHRAVTARRPGDDVQRILTVPLQVTFDRVDMHRKVPCRFVR